MTYLIDGHNLIARLPNLSLADPHDEIELIRLLARWRWRHRDVPVTVVFDPGDLPAYGARRRRRQSGITVRYAPFNSDADTVLKHLIQASRRPAQLTVVSSDREVRSAARRAGANTLSAEEFAGELTAPPEPEQKQAADETLSPEEVEAWLKLFQSQDDRPS